MDLSRLRIGQVNEMKLGLGLYRHMLTRENYQFARQAGATHIVAHLVDYFGHKTSGEGSKDDQPTGATSGKLLRHGQG